MRRVANYQGTTRNAVMYVRPAHFTRGNDYAKLHVCGSKSVSGFTPTILSVTTNRNEVTCKVCLKYLERHPYAAR